MEQITVILADDHKDLRNTLAGDLRAKETFDVLGEAENGRELLALVRKQPPDVAVVDIRMPIMDGIEAAKAIKAEFPSVKLLMLTLFDDDEYLSELFGLGVAGYMLKSTDADSGRLAEAITSVYHGANVLDGSVMRKIGSIISGNLAQSALTDMEAKVARLIADGYYNKDIAKQLDVSYGRVRNIVSSVYMKLAASSREEIAEKLEIRAEKDIP